MVILLLGNRAYPVGEVQGPSEILELEYALQGFLAVNFLDLLFGELRHVPVNLPLGAHGLPVRRATHFIRDEAPIEILLERLNGLDKAKRGYCLRPIWCSGTCCPSL